MNYKSMYKYELADAAGVLRSTFAADLETKPISHATITGPGASFRFRKERHPPRKALLST